MIHQGKKPLGIIDARCAQFVEPLKNALAEADLSAFQSFDLQSTRALHEGCTCPHHGTSQCSCELVVLLVYGPAAEPVSLVLDGRDGQTYIFIVDDTGIDARSPIYAAIERAVQTAAARQAAGL
jgi:hypothetical protein